MGAYRIFLCVFCHSFLIFRILGDHVIDKGGPVSSGQLCA